MAEASALLKVMFGDVLNFKFTNNWKQTPKSRIKMFCFCQTVEKFYYSLYILTQLSLFFSLQFLSLFYSIFSFLLSHSTLGLFLLSYFKQNHPHFSQNFLFYFPTPLTPSVLLFTYSSLSNFSFYFLSLSFPLITLRFLFTLPYVLLPHHILSFFGHFFISLSFYFSYPFFTPYSISTLLSLSYISLYFLFTLSISNFTFSLHLLSRLIFLIQVFLLNPFLCSHPAFTLLSPLFPRLN